MKNALLRTTLLAVVLLAAVPARAGEPALLHASPVEAQPGQPLRLEATLVEGESLSTLSLHYRGPGAPYRQVPMARQYGDLYRGTIPAEHLVPPGIEYYVEGRTRSGKRVALFLSAERPARVLVPGEPPAPLATSRPAPPPDDTPDTRPANSPQAAEPPREEAVAALPEVEPSEERPAAPARPPSDPPQEPLALSQPEPPGEGALYSAEDTLTLATRREETVTRVPAIAAVFGREQVRALGARTVADVLDVVPGLTLSRDVQGFHRVAVRGLRNDAEVLFLRDGHRLNSFYDGRALMSLPVENLERIEVLRGPSSSVHGAGAYLAVVNLVTDRSDGLRGAVSGGGFPGLDDRLALTGTAHLSGGQSFGALRLFADMDAWQQAGDSNPIEKDSLDDETLGQGLREPLQPAGHTRDERFLFSVGAGLEWDGGSAGHLRLSARYLTEERSALMGLFDTVGEDSRLRWDVLLADATYERRLGEGALLRARVFGDQQDTDRLFQLTPNDYRTGDALDRFFYRGMREQTRVGVRTLGGGVEADLTPHRDHRLSLGAVAERQALTDYVYGINYTPDARQLPQLTTPEGTVDPLQVAGGAVAGRLTLGLFAQDTWTVAGPLALTLGLRVDATELPAVDAQGTITGTALVPAFNPRLGLVVSASEALVLKALYSRGFRAPTLQELVEVIPDTDYNQGRFQGNPRLGLSTVDTFELGADLVQTAGGARVRLRGNAFLAFLHSPIIPVDTSGNIVPLRNREQGVRAWGVEGEARLEASRRAVAWVNASLVRAEDLEVPTHSRLLTDTPQARFNAGLSMPLGGWVNFDVVVRAGAERRNNSRSVLELIRRYKIPAYSLITAQLRSEPLLGGRLEVAAVAHNLFDHDLRDDVPRPDRVPGLLPREGLSGFLTLRARY